MPNADPPHAPPIKPPPPRRRFRLIDAMILIAATAVGLGLLRWFGNEPYETSILGQVLSEWDWRILSEPDAWSTVEGLLMLITGGLSVFLLLAPFMAAWTLALIPIRLRKPRPTRRRLGMQPGFVAACAFALVSLFTAVPLAFIAWLAGYEMAGHTWNIYNDLFIMCEPMMLGMAVAASWLTLIIGRRWRAEPHWIDRLGRIAGCYWILAVPAFWGLVLLPWLQP